VTTLKEQMVNSVIINGEKISLDTEVTAAEAQRQMEAAGFTDLTQGSTPVVSGQVLSFQQNNGEKGNN